MATIVALHAHPDDEALLMGGWLAARAADGDRTVLVLATDGAAGLSGGGWSGTPAELAEVRRQEVESAAEVLGVARVVRLEHDDSGTAEAPSPAADRFADLPVDQVAREVAAVLDEEDADVLTGYDARGGDGHPDHAQVHRVARRARDLAARRPRLLEVTLDRTWLVRGARVLRPVRRLLPGLTLPTGPVFTARSDVSLVVDVRSHLPEKVAALACHTSQTRGGIRTIGLLLRLPRPLQRRVLGTEWFVEVP